jgi:hypothetical protein
MNNNINNDDFKNKALRFKDFMAATFPSLAHSDNFSIAINEKHNLILMYSMDEKINWETLPNLPRSFENTTIEYNYMGHAVAY